MTAWAPPDGMGTTAAMTADLGAAITADTGRLLCWEAAHARTSTGTRRITSRLSARCARKRDNSRTSAPSNASAWTRPCNRCKNRLGCNLQGRAIHCVHHHMGTHEMRHGPFKPYTDPGRTECSFKLIRTELMLGSMRQCSFSFLLTTTGGRTSS